jgi:hypothetical protein
MMTRGVIRCAVKEQEINQNSRPVYFHMFTLLGVLLGPSTVEVLGNSKEDSMMSQKTRIVRCVFLFNSGLMMNF